MKVRYSENNSGGYWWLNDTDYENLKNAGWEIDGHSAIKEFKSIDNAIDEWQGITGQYAWEEGCECCGQPHNFYEE